MSKLLGDTFLVFNDKNPKRIGTKVHARYELYKKASTAHEAMNLGASRAEIANDIKQGHCKVQSENGSVATGAVIGYNESSSEVCSGVKRNALEIFDSPPRKKSALSSASSSSSFQCDLGSVSHAELAPKPSSPRTSNKSNYESEGSAAARLASLLPGSTVASAFISAASEPNPESKSDVVPPTKLPDLTSTANSSVTLTTTPSTTQTISQRKRDDEVDLSFVKLDNKPLTFIKRVMGETKRLLSKQGLSEAEQSGYQFRLLDRENLSKWAINLRDLNPDGHLAKDLASNKLDLSIDLELSMPDGYPIEPPFVRVVYPQLFGGYVFSRGGICFEPLTTKGWIPSMSLPSLAVAIKGILDYGDVRVKGVGNRQMRSIPQYTEEGARKDHTAISAAHRGGEASTYGSLKNYSS